MIAVEGLEQARQTRGKRGPEGKGEAKAEADNPGHGNEAVFRGGVANVPALADWLADHLDDAELAELVEALAANRQA